MVATASSRILHVAAVDLDDAAVAVLAGFAEQDRGAVGRQRRAGHGPRPAVGRNADGPAAEIVDRGVHPAQGRRAIDAAVAGKYQGAEIGIQGAPALQVRQQFEARAGGQRRHPLQHVAGLGEDSFGLHAHDAGRGSGLQALRLVRVQPGPSHADEDGQHQGQRHRRGITPGRRSGRHSRYRHIASRRIGRPWLPQAQPG